MKKHRVILLIFLHLLSGCNTLQAKPTTAFEVPNIISRSLEDKPKLHYQLVSQASPKLKSALRQYLKNGHASNIKTDGFIQFAYSVAQEPIISTMPFRETVISLQPGERFTNISCGDPTRWSYAVAISGAMPQQQHILIKPSQENLNTNMVITTDKRIYNVGLVTTTNHDLSRTVSFWYPEDMAQENHSPNSEADNRPDVPNHNTDMENMNFNYKVSHDWFTQRPIWTPIKIFDDSQKTYIQFPTNISTHNLPALFTLNGTQKTLVNDHVRLPYLIVDQLFEKAVLISGVGRAQQRIVITNNSSQS